MKINLKINRPYDRYPEDTKRIIEACKKFGIELEPSEAIYFWECYSDSLAAGWIILPDSDKEIYECIKEYIKEVLEEKLGDK